MDVRVVALDPHHVMSLAAMLAHTFDTDAAYTYLFPNAATRASGLRDFFAGNLRMHLPHRCTYVAEQRDGTPLATVTLRPPSGIDISLWSMVRSGLLSFGLRRGHAAVKRMMWLKKTYEQLEHQAAGHAPHSYVHMMAVTPAQQGRGMGSWLLQQVLATRVGHPAVLTTHLERNVVFYQRHGFSLADQHTVQPPGSAAYSVFAMIKQPRAGAG